MADGRAGPATLDAPEAAAAAPGSTAASQEDDKGKGKARRIPKFERLRVTGASHAPLPSLGMPNL